MTSTSKQQALQGMPEGSSLIQASLSQLQSELEALEELEPSESVYSSASDGRPIDGRILKWLGDVNDESMSLSSTDLDVSQSSGQVQETTLGTDEDNIDNQQLPSETLLDSSQSLYLRPPSHATELSSTFHHRTMSIMFLFRGVAEIIGLRANDEKARVSLIEMEDQTARFVIWGNNIGAFHEADEHVSLDFRLRDAFKLRESIFRVLEHLEESLQKITSIFSGLSSDGTWHTSSPKESNESASDSSRNSAASSETVATSIDSSISDGLEILESQELIGATKDGITSLFQFSQIIRCVPPSYGKAASRYTYDHTFDVSHVRMKFPKAFEFLIHRLGKAITMRREFFLHRREHRTKLSSESILIKGLKNQRRRVQERPEGTLSHLDQQSAPNTAFGLGRTQIDTEATPYIATQEADATADKLEIDTVGSQTSFATTIVPEDGHRPVSVPPLGDVYVDGIRCNYGEYFECPYCYTIQNVKNRHAWKKHVFHDLQPYTCTLEQCVMKLFSSRHSWFDHEVQSHRREYICICCGFESLPFDSAAAVKKHVELSHADVLAVNQIPTFIDQCQVPLRNIPISSCPLCGDGSDSQSPVRTDPGEMKPRPDKEKEKEFNDPKKFRRHLGRHMEQLALFALPRHVTIGEGHADSNEAAADRDSDSGTMATKTTTSQSSSNPSGTGTSPAQNKPIQPVSLQVALMETRPSYGKEGLYAGFVLAAYVIVASALGYYGDFDPPVFRSYALQITLEREAYVDWLKMVLGTQLDQAATNHALEHPTDKVWGEENIQGVLAGALTDVNNLNRYWSTMSRLGISLVTFWKLLELDKQGLRKWDVHNSEYETIKANISTNQQSLDEKLKAIASCNKELTRLMTAKPAESPIEVKFKSGDINARLEQEAMNGNEEMVKLLLSEGADVNAMTENSGTALQAVSWGGTASIVRLLLEYGADVNAQGGDYGNALQAASWRGNDTIVVILLEVGADVNKIGGYYGSALQAAARGGHSDTIRILLSRGADVNIFGGQFGYTLQAAARGGHEETVRLLLAHGADINAVGGEYHTALQVASMGGHKPLVRFLLESGADVNAVGGRYGTALQAAAHGGYKGIVRLLLANGADVNLKGGEYNTPLQAALVKGEEGITQLLREHGAIDLGEDG